MVPSRTAIICNLLQTYFLLSCALIIIIIIIIIVVVVNGVAGEEIW
jgi:uncharacterized membrane protein